jgi:hypothetical protein
VILPDFVGTCRSLIIVSESLKDSLARIVGLNVCRWGEKPDGSVGR